MSVKDGKSQKEGRYVKVRLFCPRFVPNEGAFDQDELLSFLEDKEIMDCANHFFMYDSFPRLLMIVTYRENKQSGGHQHQPSSKPNQIAPNHKTSETIEFTPEEHARFEGLRRWRNERAKQDGVDRYLVMSNIYNPPKLSWPRSTKVFPFWDFGYGPLLFDWIDSPNRDSSKIIARGGSNTPTET